jgi:hypothetical protein
MTMARIASPTIGANKSQSTAEPIQKQPELLLAQKLWKKKKQ